MRFYRLQAYWILLGGLVAWCALIMLGPVLAPRFPSAATLCYRFFFPICHQDPARSFFLSGKPLAVCIRCTAIYFSFFIGVVLLPWTARWLKGPALFLWLLAAGPMMADVFLDTIGLHGSGTLTRVLTGGLFGLVSARLVAPLFLEAYHEILSHQQHFRMRHEPQT